MANRLHWLLSERGLRIVSRYVIPLAVLFALWLPDFAYYYVPGAAIERELIERSRDVPGGGVLDELERMQLAVGRKFEHGQELVAAAEAMLAGELRLSAQVSRRFDISFDPADLLEPAAALPFASLFVPSVLLDAYASTGREEFYLAAKKFLLAFADFERSAWRPKGLIWNDHAIAARIPVTIKFWRIYRQRADFDRGEAGKVLQLLARSGQFLAKPSHFTFRTNHGVMQNIGLLQLCVALPSLANASSWCDTALARLHDQMRYYVNGEGVVLEHSAGYHAFGMELLGMILRALTLLDRPVPPQWDEKYRLAKAHYAALRRPDASLPLYGDTPSAGSYPLVTERQRDGGYSRLYREESWQPDAAFALYPVAGHSVWWRGLESWPQAATLSQTVVTWSHFPSRAHKLADEMSVLSWRDGHNWITNSGYWPYGRWGRRHAEGWEGSNAPHLVGEPGHVSRRTELLGYSDGISLRLIDLRRHGTDTYKARRQVVDLASGALLVLDHIEDGQRRRSTTVWTTEPGTRLDRHPGANAYRLISPEGKTMLLSLLASEGARIQTYLGSRQPFAGWVVIDGVPRAAPAFVVDQPTADSWALAVWSQQPPGIDGKAHAAPEMLEWGGSERWTLRVDGPRETVTIERAGARILVKGAGGQELERLQIRPAADISAQRRAVETAYEDSAGKSRKFRELAAYRLTLTYLLFAVLVGQEAIFWLMRRARRAWRIGARLGAGAAWIAAAFWINVVFLGY
ncbi:MAG: heparinase II/III family protein [Burkholderiales bacterium]|nr:heparinase II/III family protein [Burkholderiales bacterium]